MSEGSGIKEENWNGEILERKKLEWKNLEMGKIGVKKVLEWKKLE